MIIKEERGGLTPQEYAELLDYIAKNNGWSNILKVAERRRPLVKYVSCSYDTRDNTIWRITLRNIEEVHFRTEMGYNLKEKVYEYLDQTLEEDKEEKLPEQWITKIE